MAEFTTAENKSGRAANTARPRPRDPRDSTQSRGDCLRRHIRVPSDGLTLRAKPPVKRLYSIPLPGPDCCVSEPLVPAPACPRQPPPAPPSQKPLLESEVPPMPWRPRLVAIMANSARSRLPSRFLSKVENLLDSSGCFCASCLLTFPSPLASASLKVSVD